MGRQRHNENSLYSIMSTANIAHTCPWKHRPEQNISQAKPAHGSPEGPLRSQCAIASSFARPEIDTNRQIQLHPKSVHSWFIYSSIIGLTL